MQGNTEQQQLILISQLCGSITTEVWPGVENLELFNKMDLPKGQKRKVITIFIFSKICNIYKQCIQSEHSCPG